MKILITNTVILNGGDAAILLAEIDMLRYAFGQSTEFIIFDSQPEIASQYYPDLTFRKLMYLNITESSVKNRYLGRLLKSVTLLRFFIGLWCWKQNHLFFSKFWLKREEIRDLTEYKSADLVLSTGGTLLVENYYLWPRIFDYELSLMMKKPLVFFTQSIGRFKNKRYRKSFKKIFDQASMIFVRDEKSVKNIQNIDVRNSNLFIAADAAFALADVKNLKSRIKEDYMMPNNPKIALSVRDWRFFKSVGYEKGREIYYESIRILVEHLIRRHNAKVTFISTCQGIPEYWTDDSRVAEEIVQKVPDEVKKKLKIDLNFHTPSDLINILKGFNLVVATRLHMAILSLGAGIPVFPIAYEFKTEELFKRLGLAKWVQNIERLDIGTINKSFDAFFECLPNLTNKLFTCVMKEHLSAVESVKIIKKYFDNNLLTISNNVENFANKGKK
jgi:colanic acid/amylovoran biosynthesis protein